MNNNSFIFYFIKGMCYSGKTFSRKYLIDHFIWTTIKDILLFVPTSATATKLSSNSNTIYPSIDQLDLPKASSNKYHHH
jgi:hypothetical protein